MSKSRRPSSTDVAKLAQVSRATVSLVVNGVKDARISDSTRDRVLEAARKLRYKPNVRGRSLVSGRTDTIALVLRDIQLLEEDLYIQPLLYGILSEAQSCGFGLRVESAKTLKEEGRSVGDLIASGYVDGLIVENLDYRSHDLVEQMESGAPIVALGSQGAPREFTVQIDNVGAASSATRHLIELGRTRIAHITYSPVGVHSTDRRLEGYRAALAEAGIAGDPRLVVEANFSIQSGYDAMTHLLVSETGPPDAVFAGSDAVAMGAMAAIQDSGCRIPQDIAVVGFDDLGVSSFVRPSLTTVQSRPIEAGIFAARMLVQILKGDPPAHHRTLVGADLIQRGSTIPGYDRHRAIPGNGSSAP